MTSPVPPTFRLDRSAVYASALRAQVVERCRRALNHDMNNAVQSIHSGLELLSKCLGSPGISRVSPQECITLLQQQFVTLQQTLNRLLADIAAPPGDPETFDLSTLVTDALHTLRHERTVSKGRVSVEAPVLVRARRVNVRSVTLALILDSIDEMGMEGTLEVSVEARGKEGVIEVRNPRSSAEDVPAGDTQREARTMLQIASDLIAEEGGELDIEQSASSRLVRIRLPADVKHAAVPRDENKAALRGDTAVRVLIADRNRDAADSLAMILQLEGYDAKALYSGSQLPEEIEGYGPHVVLVDLDLPDCDARQIAREARTSRPGKVPLLAQVSSNDQVRHEEFDAHLLRPVEWAQLQSLVKTAIER